MIFLLPPPLLSSSPLFWPFSSPSFCSPLLFLLRSLLQMLVKQKEANRQSMLLLQSAEPSVQLLKALEDVAAITKTLEDERLQHQRKVNPQNVVVRKAAFDLAALKAFYIQCDLHMVQVIDSFFS